MITHSARGVRKKLSGAGETLLRPTNNDLEEERNIWIGTQEKCMINQHDERLARESARKGRTEDPFILRLREQEDVL